MIKFFRELLYKVYMIGKIEDSRRQRISELERRKNSAIIHSSSLVDSAILENTQNDRSKIRIGMMCNVNGHLMVFKHGGQITIGDHCYIGPGSRIWSAKTIEIGNRVLISYNVSIHDNSSHPLDARARHEDYKYIFTTGSFQDRIDLSEKPVMIEDDVWIGFNSTIMKGVTIGKGAIIGSNTLVNKDIPPYAVAVGNPCSIIKYLN